MCDLKVPHQVAGISLRAVLQSPDASVKDAAFTLVARGPKLYGQSVRTARWRFTRWSDGQTEHYDHDQDPDEFHDIDAENPEVVKELSMQLQEIGKPIP